MKKGGGKAEDEWTRSRRAGKEKKLKWKSEEDKWVDGGKKDESAGEKAGEGEKKVLAAVNCLFASASI